MKTDDFISALSAELKPARRERLATGLVLAAMAALGVCVVAVLFLNGVRPDFEKSSVAVALKVVFSAGFAAAALPVAARLARPGRAVGAWVGAGLAITAAAAVVSAVSYFSDARGGGALEHGFPVAIVLIPTLATPAAFVIFAWYRRFAPTRLALAGASVGALSGGLGAMAYALICPVDDMGFVSTWYGASIVACTVVGAVIGPRVLRW